MADGSDGRIRNRGPLLESSHRGFDASLRREPKSESEIHDLRLFFASLAYPKTKPKIMNLTHDLRLFFASLAYPKTKPRPEGSVTRVHGSASCWSRLGIRWKTSPNLCAALFVSEGDHRVHASGAARG